MAQITKTRNASDREDGLVDIPSHKLATGVGALVGGAAAGAALGTAAGPLGTALGAVAGAIAGGLGADALANSVDEVREEAHWRGAYRSRPYVTPDATFDDFGPAYRFGVVNFSRYPDRDFDDVQTELAGAWSASRGRSSLKWVHASPAARDAWDRLASERAARHARG